MAVVIPTLDARELLLEALASLDRQTVTAEVWIADNASRDGTAEAVAERFPRVRVVRNETNLGFGRAINEVALTLDADVLVLVNNDMELDERFVEEITSPFSDASVGMVAGVLLQAASPERVDTAGIALDVTLGSWDPLLDAPVAALERGDVAPTLPCGGAAAYRLGVFRELGGFDDYLFAYWEDVDLGIRFRLAGWKCAFAPRARALHHHSATVGSTSPRSRELSAVGRGYLLGKYGVTRRRPLVALQVALLDLPVLLVHLVARRELVPLRAWLRGRRAGRRRRVVQRPPLELASITFRQAFARKYRFAVARATRRLPEHFYRGPLVGGSDRRR